MFTPEVDLPPSIQTSFCRREHVRIYNRHEKIPYLKLPENENAAITALKMGTSTNGAEYRYRLDLELSAPKG